MPPITKSAPSPSAVASLARTLPRRASARDAAIARLWRAWRRKKSDALRNELVGAYQPLVQDVVRRMALRLPRSVDRGDLETAANVGLMAAIESYDDRRGVRFESYGELRIKGALLDELRTQDWMPRPWRSRFERHKRVLERLRSEKKAEPTDEEIARALAMPLGEYVQVFGCGLPGAPVGGGHKLDRGEGDPPALDIVADTHSDAPGDRLTRDELLRLVAQRLTEQEYRIVYLKYWEELPMREIGELENLSESRVCKIHQRLLERLKDRLGARSS